MDVTGFLKAILYQQGPKELEEFSYFKLFVGWMIVIVMSFAVFYLTVDWNISKPFKYITGIYLIVCAITFNPVFDIKGLVLLRNPMNGIRAIFAPFSLINYYLK